MNNSKYLQNYKSQQEQNCRNQIAVLDAECEQAVEKLHNTLVSKRGLFYFIKPTGIIGAILGLVYGLNHGSVAACITIFLLINLAGFGLVYLNNYFIQKKNDDINSQIQGLFYQKQLDIQRQYDICSTAVAAETQRYNNAVQSAMSDYSDSTVIEPLVQWLFQYFNGKIMAADRGAYVERITVDIEFEVKADGITILERLPHSGGNQEALNFNFFKNRYNNINDFFDRVGFTQALTKQIEFQVYMQYPMDPLAPKENLRPSVIITTDDCTAKIRYDVENPNYRIAQDFKK